MSVKALVLRSPGSNCDVESAWALEAAGAAPERVHVNAFLRGEGRLKEYGLLMFPGGFSFGDDIASGKVLANRLDNISGWSQTEPTDGGRIIRISIMKVGSTVQSSPAWRIETVGPVPQTQHWISERRQYHPCHENHEKSRPTTAQFSNE